MRTWVFGVVAALAALGCARLGFWQLDRLAQRQAANALVERRLAEPILTADDLLARPPDSLEYRRVSVSGYYDLARPIVEVFRSRNGVPGAYLVTPLMISPDRAVLVERGWTPAPDARTIDVASFDVRDSVTVEGFVRVPPGSEPTTSDEWPRYVRNVDPEALDSLLPYGVLPVVVRRTGGGEPAELTVLSLPALDEGSHFSYAVQWFSFGLIAIVGAVIWIRQQRRAEAVS